MKTRTALGLAALLAASLVSGAAVAKTVAVPDGTTDWTTLGLAANDTAKLNANTTVYVNDLASLLVVSNLNQVTLDGGNSSKIVFTVPTNETWGVNCYIRPGNIAVNKPPSGYLVKKGKGALKLRSRGEEQGSYNCNITAEDGVIDMSAMHAGSSASARRVYMGVIAVSNGASFYAPGARSSDSSMTWYTHGFAGEGIITNTRSSSTAINLDCFDSSFAWDGKTCDFGGEFKGPFTFTSACMRQFFSGTNSTFTTLDLKGGTQNYSAGEGTVGVMKFGEPGERSSIGTSSYIRWVNGGGLLYLGTGETTSKELQFQESAKPSFIDGGPHGGLVFTTALENGSTAGHAAQDKTVTLMGSNTTACALTGLVPNWAYKGVSYTFHVVKKGPGTWRLDNPTNTMTGTITVEEGMLGFSSLRERGLTSSFGTAAAVSGAAITLGADGKEGGIGLLSAGGKASCSTMRPIALAGDGRLVNNSTNILGIGKIQVTNSSGSTLTLDGTNTNSVVYDLNDGEGPLSLVKDGTGTWYLSGSNTFSGTIDVKAGTLVFSDHSNQNFTWYKFVVKELMGVSTTTLDLAELGLYDSADKRINASLTEQSDYTFLQSGRAAYVRPCIASNGDKTIANLFEGSNSKWKANLKARPTLEDESTWLEIVMRVPDGSNPAASWDVASGDRPNTDSTNSYPRVCAIMGSVDGGHYELLGEKTIDSYGDYRGWASTKVQVVPGNSNPHPGGFQLDKTTPSRLPMPTNAVVSVASNATLRAEGGRYTLSNLKVSAAGAGTIDGFDFAESGTLAVVDAPRGGATLPLQFVDCTGIRNIKNWTLTVNGEPSSYKIHVKDSTLAILPPGLMIIFR